MTRDVQWPWGIGLDKRQARRLRRRMHLESRARRRADRRDAAVRRDIRRGRSDPLDDER